MQSFWDKVKESWNKNSLSVEICATVISSEGYVYENLNKVRHDMIPSPLRVSKSSLLAIIILFNINKWSAIYKRYEFGLFAQ